MLTVVSLAEENSSSGRCHKRIVVVVVVIVKHEKIDCLNTIELV